MRIEDILPMLKKVKGTGDQYSALCPAHDDQRQSLSVSTGDDGRILLKCQAGCGIRDITAALGIKLSDLFAERSSAQRKVAAEYICTDIRGQPVHKKIRYEPKQFTQAKSDGKGGWVFSMKGVTPVLYHLPEVVQAVKSGSPVFIVEGEKDADNLRRYGKTATCGTHGAGPGKWLSHYNEYLKQAFVVIIADNDTVGKAFAAEVAGSLIDIAKCVKLLDLALKYPTLPEHGDISDVLKLLGDRAIAELEQFVADTPEYDPQAESAVEPLNLICLEDVQSHHAEWLWRPYIPRGKLTLMQGDPGQGKTMLALAIASIASNGGVFFGDEEAQRIAGIVIYQTAEDGIDDTIKPRLLKMKPDFKNIFMIDESKEGLTLSDTRIEQVMRQKRPVLMIIDPLQAYLGAGVDMHRANEVRPILSKLGRLAEPYKCAIVLIMHMSKMSQAKALYRGLGSIDIPAAARSVLVVGSNPDNPDEKIMAHEKSSLARHGKSIAFHIDFDNGGVVFDGYSDLTADQITAPKQESRGKASASLDEAVDLLERLLGEQGFAKLEDIRAAASEAGVSKSTLYRARDELALKTLSLGFSSDRKTWWRLPNVQKDDIEKDMGKMDQTSFEGTWPPS